jgi:hypothetical protein
MDDPICQLRLWFVDLTGGPTQRSRLLCGHPLSVHENPDSKWGWCQRCDVRDNPDTFHKFVYPDA